MKAEDTAVSRSDLLWKQYELHVGLYKFYLELVVRVNVFYYAITGAIASYYFSHETNGVVRFSLLLPIGFSFAIGGMFLYGASLLGVVRSELVSIRIQLELEAEPDVQVLVVLLRLFAIIILGVGVGLTVLFLVSRHGV